MSRIIRNHKANDLTSISPRQIPSLSYTIQNIFISLATIAVSSASLFLMIYIVLPLAFLRALLPLDMVTLKGVIGSSRGIGNGKHRRVDDEEEEERLSELRSNKVVLVLSAARGIGFNIVKQYANEEGTVVIAASSSVDILRKSIVSLGETPAIIESVELNLTWPQQKIMTSIRDIDQAYGPITHLFGLSNYIQEWETRGLNENRDMICANINGTVTAILATYDRMKGRGYGKICVVGSLAGNFCPPNMISYSSIKDFINTFTTSLRLLAAPCGVDVVCIQPGLIDTHMTKRMHEQGSIIGPSFWGSAEKLAARMKDGVEEGGRGIVIWPASQGAAMYALRGVNPICEELGRWVLMKMTLGRRKNI